MRTELQAAVATMDRDELELTWERLTCRDARYAPANDALLRQQVWAWATTDDATSDRVLEWHADERQEVRA